MGVPRQSFGGASIVLPGVYSKSEFPPGAGATGPATNIVAVIGSAKGGVPYNATGLNDEEKVNRIANVAQAIDLLRGGAGFYMTEFYLSPTRDAALNLPTQCLFFRVDPAVQGSATLQDVGLNDVIDLTTSRYGALANQVTRQITAGTTIGHRVVIKFQGNTIVDKDDVGFEYLEIQYTGAGSAATMTINATQLTTSVTGGPGGEDLTIAFTDFPKLGDVVSFINEQPAYTCSLKGLSDADSTTFDAVTAQDIATAAYTALANVEALIQFFNNESGGEVIAELSSGAVRTDVTNDANFVFFTSGSDGTPTSTDWANTLELMKKFRINHILAATGDTSIHSMVITHCLEMSGVIGKRNRSCSAGAVSGLSVAARIAEQKAANSPRFEYHFTPIRRPDILANGEVKTFAPFYGAALTAGIRFGNDVTISATFKGINVVGLGELLDDTTADQVVSAGGTVFGFDENLSFHVRHNVTTFQGQNLILNLPSMLRTADAITLDAQTRIQSRIAALDRAPSELTIEDMKNFLVTNLLPDYRDAKGWLTNDTINGVPAFSDVQFQLSGDRFDFLFTGQIPAPLHYGFVTQKFIVPGFTQQAA